MRATIRDNVELPLTVKRKAEHTIVYLSGARGTAVVNICYTNEEGGLIPYTGGTNVALGDQYTITHGEEVTPILEVTGANGATAIDVFSVALGTLIQ